MNRLSLFADCEWFCLHGPSNCKISLQLSVFFLPCSSSSTMFYIRFVLACRSFAINGTARAELCTCVASVRVQTLVACTVALPTLSSGVDACRRFLNRRQCAIGLTEFELHDVKRYRACCWLILLWPCAANSPSKSLINYCFWWSFWWSVTAWRTGSSYTAMSGIDWGRHGLAD